MKTKYTITITVESWNNHEIDMALLLEQAHDAAEYLHLGTTTIRGNVIQDGIDGPQVSEVTDDQEPAKTDTKTINIKPSNLDTVNGYMGHDCIQPFIDVAMPQKKGLFALVRTSNPGGDRLQTLKLADGRQMVDEMAAFVAEIGEQSVGDCGYSLLGAVVGATKVEDIARLRKLMPQQIFLVPGYGAQGGGAQDVKASFKADGTGAIITASRSVIYAHVSKPDMDWKVAVAEGAAELNREIRAILG